VIYLSNTPALFVREDGEAAVTVKRLAPQDGRPVGESVLDVLAEAGGVEPLLRIFATPAGLQALAAALAEAATLLEAAPEGERIAVVKRLEWRPMDL
jgi:hypothetical protein